MSFYAELLSSVMQILVATGIGFVAYGGSRLLRRSTPNKGSFSNFIGFSSAKYQLDRKFLLILLAMVLFGISTTVLEYRFSVSLRSLLTSESSPYSKILHHGFNGAALAGGVLYCFVQSAGAEEILFRGLIARRFFHLLGLSWGNLAQAAVFWSMHLFLFRLLTGEWFSVLQLFTFFTSFGMGLVLGYVNFRKNGESILPSWILHSCANFATFLTLAFLAS